MRKLVFALLVVAGCNQSDQATTETIPPRYAAAPQAASSLQMGPSGINKPDVDPTNQMQVVISGVVGDGAAINGNWTLSRLLRGGAPTWEAWDISRGVTIQVVHGRGNIELIADQHRRILLYHQGGGSIPNSWQFQGRGNHGGMVNGNDAIGARVQIDAQNAR